MPRRNDAEKLFVIPCSVSLAAAHMLVRAKDADEALAKARSNNHDDIDWSTAELVDWVVTGQPKEQKE